VSEQIKIITDYIFGNYMNITTIYKLHKLQIIYRSY